MLKLVSLVIVKTFPINSDINLKWLIFLFVLQARIIADSIVSSIKALGILHLFYQEHDWLWKMR